MALEPSHFEKLGVFYLGRPFDPVTKEPGKVPFLYDSRDLLTHAVCVGMTGSGKTGLCLSLLEEAAIDGVPAIIIDPKGDIGNLMLTFPDLKPEDFLPWIDQDEARRQGVSPEEHAAAQAELWRKGLADWGQGPERIRMLKDKADVAIYTPGSTSGIPVNLLASFDAPQQADPEALAEHAQNSAASLLGLLKISSDPLQSREGILLSTILTCAWSQESHLDLGQLIEFIQRPPFDKVGILDLETFYPAKERFELVMALNNILASPSFATWRSGEPLHIADSLFTSEGKPRLSIFSLAHLGEDERMFFVSLLLNEVVSWTRSQSGTTSLRAILYMDEIFGYLPPSGNPPSKRPMLTMLKQARAFGVGVVLATQNPVDLDYKALSNAGTWFIGRLQTERDKARVLDGLQGASSGRSFNRQSMEALLAGLGKRIFLMNNVNDDAPTVFESRWAMSYLRGPLTRDQIALLMQDRKQSPQPVQRAPNAPANSSRPSLPPGVPEVFFPKAGDAPTRYHPVLFATADLAYKNARLGFDYQESIALCAPIPVGSGAPDWEVAEPSPLKSKDLQYTPAAGATYEELPASAALPKNYVGWEKDFRAWLMSSRTLDVQRCAELKLVSAPNESASSFRGRVALACREARDAGIAALRKKYSVRLTALQGRIDRAEATLLQRKARTTQTHIQSAISVGSSLLGAFLGKKTFSAANVGRITTAARGIGRTMNAGSTVASAQENLEALRAQRADLEAEFEAECATLTTREPEIETIALKPLRGGITNLRLVLGWNPEP